MITTILTSLRLELKPKHMRELIPKQGRKYVSCLNNTYKVKGVFEVNLQGSEAIPL